MYFILWIIYLMKLQRYSSIFLLTVHSNFFLGEYAKYYFHLRSMMSKLGMKENELAPLDVKGLSCIFFYFPFFYYHFPCPIIFYLPFYLFFFLFFFTASDLFEWLYSHELLFNIILSLFFITLHYTHYICWKLLKNWQILNCFEFLKSYLFPLFSFFSGARKLQLVTEAYQESKITTTGTSLFHSILSYSILLHSLLFFWR